MKNKLKQLKKLERKVKQCKRCSLYKLRTNIVFGQGRPNSKIVLVGEAPGREEDFRGKPFVGRAGRLLNEILFKVGLKRTHLYITNILRCRPPRNRPPKVKEIAFCKPYLIKQLEILKPKLILALGGTSSFALLNKRISISELRKKIYDYQGMKLLVSYHPAYILRNPAMKKALERDLFRIKRL